MQKIPAGDDGQYARSEKRTKKKPPAGGKRVGGVSLGVRAEWTGKGRGRWVNAHPERRFQRGPLQESKGTSTGYLEICSVARLSAMLLNTALSCEACDTSKYMFEALAHLRSSD